MRAELSKGKETVRFEWNDGMSVGLVKVTGSHPIRETYEDMQFAREYWANLIKSGFRRLNEQVPDMEMFPYVPRGTI